MTKTTAKICFTLVLASAMCTAHAEWKTPTAGELAEGCARGGDTAKAAQGHFALCSAPIKAFVDGYRRGANKGLRTAFTADQANLATTRGIDDVVQRVTAIRPAAECIPKAATTEQIESVFVNYIKAHPTYASVDYPSVLSSAIEEYFCPDR